MTQLLNKDLHRLFYVLVLLNVTQWSNAQGPDAKWFAPQPKDTRRELTEQRYHYELAKSALSKNKLEEYQKNYAKLGDYPLVPYLDYMQLKKNIYDFEFSKIDTFFTANEGSYLEYRLRSHLLHALAKRRKWRDFNSYYTPNMRQQSLLCMSLYARIATGDNQAYSEVSDIWIQGKSQPKDCDPLFKKWRKHGGLTDDIAWTRFDNAIQNKKISLARYVVRFMSEKNKAYAKEYLGIHAYPARIKQQRRFSEQSLKTQQIIAHGIRRFARIDPLKALEYWERYEAQQLFPSDISTKTKVYLIKRLAFKGFVQEAETLIANSQELRQQDVIEQLIRESLRTQEYAKVIRLIDYLSPKAQASNRWRYWRARAQDELGAGNSDNSSTSIYQELSQTRSFYGFLSADLLNRDYTLEHKPSAVLPSTLLVVRKNPAIIRAKELWLKGSFREAQGEWHFATKNMPPVELAAAGHIARHWGWYNQGIHAMIRGNLWDDLDVRFPLAYRETVEKAASNTDIENTFIYAIARQESAFSEKARSSAGAMGLMQLMPATARQTAKKGGIKKHRDSLLLDPEYNISLGSRYLDELLEKYKGNRILAAAAYNAGPHRVNGWIKDTPADVPFDVWIETIPFKETRGYVQNVLAFSVIYAYRLGQPSTFITDNEINLPL
ncbi:transglycosylase SLT domain-containing protein [Agarilytica rhodophyticola]|uniref:transglycosylase SLT domain-containing protein n=1 Tax=Agarilytica rhodophyticola TaxID=1737490 RepID=UPI000B3410FE|nr:transglycosylase SLT domain-containing protein [Agarilytica rhodophyticola]